MKLLNVLLTAFLLSAPASCDFDSLFSDLMGGNISNENVDLTLVKDLGITSKDIDVLDVVPSKLSSVGVIDVVAFSLDGKIGYIFNCETQGFGGPIKFQIAVYDYKVLGYQNVSNSETPSYGGRLIEDIIDYFSTNPNTNEVISEFENIEAGCSITSKPLGECINACIDYYYETVGEGPIYSTPVYESSMPNGGGNYPSTNSSPNYSEGPSYSESASIPGFEESFSTHETLPSPDESFSSSVEEGFEIPEEAKFFSKGLIAEIFSRASNLLYVTDIQNNENKERMHIINNDYDYTTATMVLKTFYEIYRSEKFTSNAFLPNTCYANYSGADITTDLFTKYNETEATITGMLRMYSDVFAPKETYYFVKLKLDSSRTGVTSVRVSHLDNSGFESFVCEDGCFAVLDTNSSIEDDECKYIREEIYALRDELDIRRYNSVILYADFCEELLKGTEYDGFELYSPCEGKADILIHFFDANDPIDMQEQSIITYDGEHHPSTGCLYNANDGYLEAFACATGKVTDIVEDPIYGNMIYIEGLDGTVYIYGSISRPLVRKNSYVVSGQKIASASTCKAFANYNSSIYLMIMENGQYIDPEEYFNK